MSPRRSPVGNSERIRTTSRAGDRRRAVAAELSSGRRGRGDAHRADLVICYLDRWVIASGPLGPPGTRAIGLVQRPP
jgi:hypothetical protein